MNSSGSHVERMDRPGRQVPLQPRNAGEAPPPFAKEAWGILPIHTIGYGQNPPALLKKGELAYCAHHWKLDWVLDPTRPGISHCCFFVTAELLFECRQNTLLLVHQEIRFKHEVYPMANHRLFVGESAYEMGRVRR